MPPNIKSYCPVALFVTLGYLTAFTANLNAAGPEYISSEEPAPESAAELQGPLSEAFEEEERVRLYAIKEILRPLPPFWRDSRVDLKLRSYYLGRNNVGNSKNEAWAAGGWLSYESGWWKNRLQIGAVGYTSQRLYGPESRDGTLLLKPGQQGFSVLGQLYAHARVTD